MTKQNKDKLIYVGSIVDAHGLRGLVKVKSFTEPKDEICKLQLFDINNKCLNLSLLNYASKYLICKIADVTNRDTAEKFKGIKLYILRSTLPKLQGEFYLSDLLLLPVLNTGGKVVGVVHKIHNFNASDLIEIKFNNGTQELYPFTDAIFPKITQDNVTFIPPTIA